MNIDRDTPELTGRDNQKPSPAVHGFSLPQTESPVVWLTK